MGRLKGFSAIAIMVCVFLIVISTQSAVASRGGEQWWVSQYHNGQPSSWFVMNIIMKSQTKGIVFTSDGETGTIIYRCFGVKLAIGNKRYCGFLFTRFMCGTMVDTKKRASSGIWWAIKL